MSDRFKVVRDCYGAYESGDRDVLEHHLADDVGFEGDKISRVEVYFGWDVD